jgi:hypothetical protein
MANKTLHEFSAPTTTNIKTGQTVNIGDEGFELKLALINMVQVNQFCGKAHEDASAHLQHFMEIYSTFTIKGVERDAILLHLFHSHSWEGQRDGSTPRERKTLHGISATLLPR